MNTFAKAQQSAPQGMTNASKAFAKAQQACAETENANNICKRPAQRLLKPKQIPKNVCQAYIAFAKAENVHQTVNTVYRGVTANQR
eukprot:1974715-Alexandrium_andersonii.AAC.1